MPSEPQVPWTDEQWARVNQVIQEEASRARVAATFLPLYGPLPPDTDFVRKEVISYLPPPPSPPPRKIDIADRQTLQLATLQVKVDVRTAQTADPEMRSVLALFRRAANVLARLEDAVVFRGLSGSPLEPKGGVDDLPEIWEIRGGEATEGLWEWEPDPAKRDWHWNPVSATGEDLVRGVSKAIGELEAHGHFGPFAVVLGQRLFVIAQTPNDKSLVLPQDRIIPFLGGGSLLRSSTLDNFGGYSGVVVALGGVPVELVVARDMSLDFLQVTAEPRFLFRVREKIALRIKETDAIVKLYVPVPTVTKVDPNHGPAAGGMRVVITGTNFLGATEVVFDGAPEKKLTVESDTQIAMSVPAHAAGVVHVKVTTASGTGPEENTPSNAFTYE
jgi:uncharacterized linocin/CFP29 family protein